FFLLRSRQPTGSSLFPYTTLFRSVGRAAARPHRHNDGSQALRSLDSRGHQKHGWHCVADDGLPTGLERSWATYKATLVSFTKRRDRKSTRLNSSHVKISYAVFCLK